MLPLLYRLLRQLREKHGCSSLKLSTEDAGNTFAQIEFYARHFGKRVPLEVKIGGPEARNDMRTLARFPVAAFIAPMIESPYAVEKFIAALDDSVSAQRRRRLRRRINIETATAVRQLPAITAAPAFRSIDQVTIGRSDLSRSLGVGTEDARVYRCCRKIIAATGKHRIPVSIGGTITPGSAATLLKRVKPGYINTRSIAFKVTSRWHPADAIMLALEAEAEFLRLDTREGWISKREAGQRIRSLEKRARQ